MSNEDYYKRWLKVKEQIQAAVLEDERLQEIAEAYIGIKPQGTAVEIVAKVYCKFCELYNKLCDCYDQMEQVQRRPFIRKIIDAVTCRLLELKATLEDVEVFEFTYPDNALIPMLMTPDDIQILCPFHYPFETRDEEMQYIADEIFAGNRLGDVPPTQSELMRQQQEEEGAKEEETEAEAKENLPRYIESTVSNESVHLSPEELEELRLQQEYNEHLFNIQRMERSRYCTREVTRKINKDNTLYLELAGLKAPQPRESLRIKAASYIQRICRQFMHLKRTHAREKELKLKLGMVLPSWSPPSAKAQLEIVREERRKFRSNYYKKWLEENMKQNSRVLMLKQGDVMEDISSEIRDWLRAWYKEARVFDDFPSPLDGGSILIVRGDTFTIPEYLEWRQEEEKRRKAAAANPKTKEQIKEEKQKARLEKKRIELDAKLKEQKRILDYKKLRLNPDNDPGVYVKVGKQIEPVRRAWEDYQGEWKNLDTEDAPDNVMKGYIMQLVIESAYQNMQFQLRPIVDEMMILELKRLNKALQADYDKAGLPIPIIMKRPKPKKERPPKPNPVTPATMFQALVDEGVIRKYPHTTLDDYWGDNNFAAADTRAILWTPTFPPQCLGDVREQVRNRCILSLCSNCENVSKTQLLVGPKGSGKLSLVYAVATETNSILIDLSPLNIYNKFPGPKNLKIMFSYINVISKLMEPTIILVNNAEKIFYKKVPKEDKLFDVTRLQRDFFKEVIKPLDPTAKILVMGTACEPWLSKNAGLYKIFPSLIMVPKSDYGSIFIILKKILMKYHGIHRDFNISTVAQCLRGYDVSTIIKATRGMLNGKRIAELKHIPLRPEEIINAVLEHPEVVYTGPNEVAMYQQWYESYSPWGKNFKDYMAMLDSQLQYYMKALEKSKKK